MSYLTSSGVQMLSPPLGVKPLSIRSDNVVRLRGASSESGSALASPPSVPSSKAPRSHTALAADAKVEQRVCGYVNKNGKVNTL